VFKFDVSLTEDLQKRIEFLDWFAQVQQVFTQITYVEETKGDEPIAPKSKMRLEQVVTLMNEGSAKGYDCL
jgi:hypothetical protein